VRGHHDAIGFSGGDAQTLTDMGAGTWIGVGGAVNLTINGFQSDPTGTVHLPSETTAPVVKSDGAGGTILTTGAGGTIHFVGDVVPLSQIVSSVPPTMAFIAPVTPDPPPDPPPAPPPTTAPVYNLASPSEMRSLTQSDTNFSLVSTNNMLQLNDGSTNDRITVLGTTDNVVLFGATACTVTDLGHGTYLDLYLVAGQTAPVRDWQLDPTATVHLAWSGLGVSVAPDMQGGQMLTTAQGGKVDFVGDTSPIRFV